MKGSGETISAAEAPLIDLKNSSLGGNIDARQVQELPVNGRNWMALALLAPGSRTQAGATGTAAETPLPDRNGGDVWQPGFRRPSGGRITPV
jgi:hypothetical protein